MSSVMDQLLKKYFYRIIDSNRMYTHVSLLGGKYYLDGSKEKAFISDYIKIVEENIKLEKENKPLIPLHFAEHTSYNVPFIIDIDIKIPKSQFKNIPKKLYEDKDCETFIQITNQILSEKIDLKEKEHELRGIVLEKNLSESGDYIKQGIHIHYPNLILDREDISNVIIPEIRKQISQHDKIFPGIPQNCLIIDDIAKKPWLMYGSFKPNGKPYYATKSFDDNGRSRMIYEAFHQNFNTTKENVKKDLPQLLSILWTNQLIKNDKKKLQLANLKEIYTDVKFDIENIIVKEKNINVPETFTNYDPSVVSDSKLKYFKIKKLLKMLNQTRSDVYEKWWEIGVILFNEGKGTELYLDLWKEFSKQSSQYDPNACDFYWQQMEKKQKFLIKKKGYGTLMYLCREDNPDFQAKYLEVEINPFDNETILYIPTTETKIAKLVYRILAGNYMYDVANSQWYSYKQPIWNPCKKISTLLIPEFEKIVSLYKFRINKSVNFMKGRMPEGKKSKKVVEQIIKNNQTGLKILQKKLENISGIKNIITMLESFCGEQSVEFNTNPNLIAFENGIFDSIAKKFRIGHPSDMINKKIVTKYNQELTLDSPAVKNLLNFFDQIFPNKSIRDYFLQTNTDFIVGKNNRKLNIWKGNGANGKSLTQQLYEKMLKGLCVKIPKSVVCVTQKDNQSGPSPELSRLDGGMRWVVTDEVKRGEDTLSASKICQLTGNDTIYARGLYESGKDIQPMFQLNILCNTLPTIQSADEATWDRIKIIPFESKFVDNAEKYKNKKNIFQQNKNFDIKPLIEPLLWLSVHYFKNPMKDVLENPPAPVIEAIDKYKESNCIVTQFITENFVETDNDTNKIFPKNCYEEFKKWFSDSFPNGIKNIIGRKEFIELFFNNFQGFNYNDTYITNIKFIENNDNFVENMTKV